jgi:hypothetical protein
MPVQYEEWKPVPSEIASSLCEGTNVDGLSHYETYTSSIAPSIQVIGL